jgi:SAM-dependent methyltransferase
MLAAFASAEAQTPAGRPRGEAPHPQEPRDPHSPRNVERFIGSMENPNRLEYENPDDVIAVLKVRPTDWIVDLGCGPGFYTRRLARAVPNGVVFAVDVEPRQLDRLSERLAEDGLENVVPVLTPPDEPRVPPKRADLVIVVNTYHHFENRVAYVGKIRRALKPGGRLVIVDFHKRELPVGPPPPHKLARDQVVSEVEAGGFRFIEEHDLLKYQYFLVFVPREA